ncbi:Folate-binding protein YgfZ [Candidatus Hepatincolaceae symbiont of Richtersius coronifer]
MQFSLIQLPRAIIKIEGPDRKLFLQGLISNDINKLEKIDEIEPPNKVFRGLYTGLFTNKGRYDFDFFVILFKDYYLIDVQQNASSILLNKLKFYKLISKISISLQEQQKVFALLFLNVNAEKEDSANTLLNFITANLNQFPDLLVYQDLRVKNMGFRILTPLESKPLYSLLSSVTKSNSNMNINPGEIQEYDYFRYINGILQQEELIREKSIPLEVGFDELNAIAYNKGCYLGQEFTNSCKNLLVIRKRVIPFVMGNKEEGVEIKVGDKVYIKALNLEEKHNLEVGEILGIKSIGNAKICLLVLFKMEFIKETVYYQDITLQAIIPNWLNYS